MPKSRPNFLADFWAVTSITVHPGGMSDSAVHSKFFQNSFSFFFASFKAFFFASSAPSFVFGSSLSPAFSSLVLLVSAPAASPSALALASASAFFLFYSAAKSTDFSTAITPRNFLELFTNSQLFISIDY